jgi:hypothetical protein
MNDVVDAILADLRAKMLALSAPAQVYFGAVPTNAVLPYCWIYIGDDIPAEPYFGMMSTLVVLHLYARSAREIQLMENAVVYLDDYRAPNFGLAWAPHYRVQSKPRLPEDEGRWHTTVSYLVDYADRRKMGVG